MSLFSRLYPEKSVENVLQSSIGVLAAQSVQKAISEVFPVLWNNHSVQLKGNLVTTNVLKVKYYTGRLLLHIVPG